MLEGQREVIIGAGDENDEDEEMSDATDEVSPAEDSEDDDSDEESEDEDEDEEEEGSEAGSEEGEEASVEGEEGGDTGDEDEDEETGIEALLAEDDAEPEIREEPGSVGADGEAVQAEKAVDGTGVDAHAHVDQPIETAAVAEITEATEERATTAAEATAIPSTEVPLPATDVADVPSSTIAVTQGAVTQDVVPEKPPVSSDQLATASSALPADAVEPTATSVFQSDAMDEDVSAPNGVSSPAAAAASSPAPSRRIPRASRSVSVTNVKTEDPDANDVEFEEEDDELSEKDHALDVEMEEAEQGDEDGAADSEDEELLADANIPIEELLKRYGYDVPGSGDDAAEAEVTPEKPQENGVTEVISAANLPATNVAETHEGAAENGIARVETDKSLLDEALARQPSPGLIVEGKRARRTRSVWTPEDNPPPLPPQPKRVKIVPVEPEHEPTPELSSEEETDSDEDMEEDGEEEGDDPAEPEDPTKIRPPFLLRGTLRPYQQAGLEWLASLYANQMNGILADEMGLGKTIQTIALLGHLACDKGVWGQHLIIVPTSVILNWEMEFKKFLPGLKILTYYGNQKERKEKRKGWHTENTWQVCITSYQIVLADQHIFRRKNWVYMILDEAHNIKNFRSQRWQTLLGFKASRRLLLTGTPLQNNLMELWSLLYFLMPNGVTADATAVVGFANHKEFSEWFSSES